MTRGEILADQHKDECVTRGYFRLRQQGCNQAEAVRQIDAWLANYNLTTAAARQCEVDYWTRAAR